MEKWRMRAIDLLTSLAFGGRGEVSVVPYYPQKINISGREGKYFPRTIPEKKGISSMRLYNMLCELHMESYPNEMDEKDFIMSDPYCKYSISVEGGGFSKTITANQVGLSSIEDVGKTKKAKNYLEVIDEIVEILTGTDEWRALPDYEFLYD